MDALHATAESATQGKTVEPKKNHQNMFSFYVIKINMTLVGFATFFFFPLKAASVHLVLEIWACSPNKHRPLKQSSEIAKMPVL